MAKKQKKGKRTWIIALIIIIAIGIIIYSLAYKPPKKGNEYFTEQPETWIEDKYETEEPDDIEINIYKATRTKSIVEPGKQEYYTKGDITSFFYTGFYKGDSFSNLYAGDKEELINLTRDKPIQEQKRIAEEHAIMRIDSKLNPNDGVIDSFVLAREENGKFVFYIFLDEDWKNKVDYTSILWGNNFRDKNTMHMKPFDFSESKNGLYINKIDEDVGWNDFDPVKGGMMVGEIDYKVLDKLLAYEEFSETFIMVR